MSHSRPSTVDPSAAGLQQFSGGPTAQVHQTCVITRSLLLHETDELSEARVLV